MFPVHISMSGSVWNVITFLYLNSLIESLSGKRHEKIVPA